MYVCMYIMMYVCNEWIAGGGWYKLSDTKTTCYSLFVLLILTLTDMLLVNLTVVILGSLEVWTDC